MATHSSILAWKSPWTEEPGGLQSMTLHDWTCVHEGGGRWVGSNKVVELKKKKKKNSCILPVLTFIAVFPLVQGPIQDYALLLTVVSLQSPLIWNRSMTLLKRVKKTILSNVLVSWKRFKIVTRFSQCGYNLCWSLCYILIGDGTVSKELFLSCWYWSKFVIICSYYSPHKWCWLEMFWNRLGFFFFCHIIQI